MKKILCLDSDPIGEELLQSIQYHYNDPNAELVQVTDTMMFKEKLMGPDRWNLIIINFHVLDLQDMRGKEIEDFISNIKDQQSVQLQIIATTGDSYQKTCLEKIGLYVMSKDYNTEQVSKFFKESTKRKKCSISIEMIGKIVSEYFTVPYALTLTPTRKREVVQARHISMHLTKKFTPYSLKTIGEHYGGRNHTTVMHSLQVVQDLMGNNETFKGDIAILVGKIKYL